MTYTTFDKKKEKKKKKLENQLHLHFFKSIE